MAKKTLGALLGATAKNSLQGGTKAVSLEESKAKEGSSKNNDNSPTNNQITQCMPMLSHRFLPVKTAGKSST